MGWSITLGSVRGTVIRIHLTFLLLLAWIGYAHYREGGGAAAVDGVVYIALLFLCVLLHELGHVFAARRYGIRTPDITLLPIGGVARLERIPEEPRQEIAVALAGPAVNLLIAAILVLVTGWRMPDAESAAATVASPGPDLAARLLMANLFLAAFNLLPAFPMDGGRVLRAVLASRMGFTRGTRAAATVGQGLAFLMGLAGLFAGNVVLLFVALFVYLGAAAEAHSVQIRQLARGMLAEDAMITIFETLSPAARVEDAVQCLIRTTQHEFPIVDGAGRLRGLLGRSGMIRALHDRGPDTPVLEVMEREVPLLQRRNSLEDVLAALRSEASAVGVVDADGRLVGLITAENVGELLMVQAARPQPPADDARLSGRPGTA